MLIYINNMGEGTLSFYKPNLILEWGNSNFVLITFIKRLDIWGPILCQIFSQVYIDKEETTIFFQVTSIPKEFL